MAKFLLITKAFEAKMMPLLLEREGHQCKVYVEDHTQKEILKGTAKHVDDWHEQIDWADVIVFDDIGFGATADWLRKNGYRVWGGSAQGDKMEENREFGMKIFKLLGLNVPNYVSFRDFRAAKDFIKQHPARWCFKPNKNIAKEFTYCGKFDDGNDLIATMDSFEKEWPTDESVDFILQEFVKGVGEVGVGAFFNGSDWVRNKAGKIVCEIDQEHKPLYGQGRLGGETGVNTGEQGNVAFMATEPKIFFETLNKLTPFLKKINYIGEIALGLIMGQDGKLWVLESTARLGYPITWQHSTMHITPWSELFVKMVLGKNNFLEYRGGICMAVVVSTPPYPFTREKNDYAGAQIMFKGQLVPEEILKLPGYYWCEVKVDERKLVTAGVSGYTVVITGMGKTINEAQNKVKARIDEFTVKDRGWRNDIGEKTKAFLPLLVKHGLVSSFHYTGLNLGSQKPSQRST